MLYCLVLCQPYNLTYFFAKRIIHVKDKRNKLIPYGMFLTRVYHYYMNSHQYLWSRAYTLVNRVLEPFSESHMVSFLNLENERYDTSSSDDDEWKYGKLIKSIGKVIKASSTIEENEVLKLAIY